MSLPSVNLTERLLEEVQAHRHADYPVSPWILNRWSSRSFSDRAVSDEALHTVLEAARWAPSSSNLQPWRFVVARTREERERFQAFIRPTNRLWTDRAPVLILLASHKLNANGEPNGAHAFDTGAAWGILALQAALLGLSTRAVGGFDREIARRILHVPDDVELHAVVALGYRGEKETLHESFRDREVPNSRRPLADSLIEGAWPDTAP
ncbi:nitroreductase family protein [Paenibacillus sp. HJGM_3]|uniref:nitroreductase family protein n=1 Tax=Paenibacillus sp. HJGM_3 TaxID=3379816 RepID=UPI00385AAE2A